MLLVYEKGRLRRAELRDYLEAVKMLLQTIPLGKVVSYKDLADILKIPPILVGKLLSMNNEAPIVPCHRVVNSNGKLGGYSGPGGLEFKKKLLELEGVHLENNHVPKKYFYKISVMVSKVS